MKRFSMAMTWLALAGLMTTVSCRKPVVGFTNGEARTVTVSAVTESGGGSKTAIDGLYVKWSEDDEISMNGCKLTLEEGAGGTMGRFTGEVTDDGPYLIGYPFGNTKYDNGTLKLSIRDSWTYADMKEIVPMAAYAEKVDDDVKFHNAVNMLKLQLKGDDTPASKLKSIVLTSTTSNLSGDISVTFDGEGNPTFNAIADADRAGKTTMTVSFGEEGLQLGNTVKCVYIPLAKMENGGDLTVRFNCANGKYMEKKVTVDANFNDVNNMLSAPELPVEATDKDHEYVDLGLSVKWATCNVGADSPEEYGDYYQWGGVTPVTSKDINVSWANCPGNDGNSGYNATAFNKWRTTHLTNNVLNPEVDAATDNWGGGWRMPTTGEWKELYDNTTSTWTTENGVYGRKFTSTKEGYTGRYIFLPPAGYRFGTSLNFAGSRGYYWSSSHGSSGPSDGEVGMYFLSGNVDPQLISYRCYGFPVRPVR